MESVMKTQKELGYKVTEASSDDIQKWMSMPVIEQMKIDWIKEAKNNGLENAEEIVNKVGIVIEEVIAEEILNK